MKSQSRILNLFRNLAFQVFLAIAAGILVGYLFPSFAVKLEIIGNSFIKIINL